MRTGIGAAGKVPRVSDGLVIEGEPVELTFLFTDIQGSTGLWDRYPTEMVSVLRLTPAR